MKKILYIIIPVVIVVMVVVKLRTNKEITDNKVYQIDKSEQIHVTAHTVTITEVNAPYEFPGIFEPNKETKISADIQGKITEMLVDVGTSVQKGQTLIQLDNSLLKIQLQSAEVQIEGLEADVKRYLVLAKADAIQEIQLEKSELALKAAKLNRATLIEQINKTAVKAPFDGVITAKLTDEGAFAAPGIPLLQLTNILSLRFSVNVTETDLKYFEEGNTVTVIPDQYSDLYLEGKIILTGSKANTANGFPVQILVNNTEGNKIKAGMFGRVKIQGNYSQKGILIPSSAVVGNAMQPEVYVVENGKASLRKVKLRGRIAEKVIIESGLQAGETLITGGILNLFDGANVKIK